MTGWPGIVLGACDPYPAAADTTAYLAAKDYRRSSHLTRVLDGLDADELKQIARTLANLHPRDFEQELLWIAERRAGK